MGKRNKRLKGRIETNTAKANQAIQAAGKSMDDTDALKKKVKALAQDIMIGGIIIILTALFYDLIAQYSLHHHNKGFGADQITLLIIGLIITAWGAFRR